MLTYIIFLLFKFQIFLLITIVIPINKLKCLIEFQLLMVPYLIFKHYSTLLYLLLKIKKKKKYTVIYIPLLCIITLNQKKRKRKR